MSEEIEKELSFRRFADDKQEQVRQLIAYTTLMGLTGKDLISIGGTLNRIKERQEQVANLHIAEGYAAKIATFGKTKSDKETNTGRRWVYVDALGAKWEFKTVSFYQCEITNRSTNKRKHFYLDVYFSKYLKGKGYMYNALLNLHYGNIQLNF
jgi:hypothetical protein